MSLKTKIKHFLLPRESNNYQAKILHPSFLVLFAFIFCLNQLSISLFALARPGVLGYSSEITPEKIISLTNRERQEMGLSALSLNKKLSEAAQMKAGDMFAFDYWAHQSPSGRQPWSFLKEVGYNYRVAGENLARDFSEPESVVNAWMKSPSHRENIVSPKFKEIGVAVVDGTLSGVQTTLVVQFFGTKSSAYAAETSPSKFEPVATVSEKASPMVLAQNKPLVSPLGLTKGIGIFFFGIISGALILDSYLVIRKRVYRSTGRTTAHAAFLAVIFLLILLKGGPGLIN